MSELNITKGKMIAGIDAEDFCVDCDMEDCEALTWKYVGLSDNEPIAILLLNGIFDDCSEEIDANADLVAEAFNVANETGKTPRQLLEQRNDLLAAIKGLKELYQLEGAPKEGGHGPYKPGSLEWQRECRKRHEAAAEAIAEAEGRS